MNRREFLVAGGSGSIGLALAACAVRTPPRRLLRPAVNLVPADVSWERIIRTTVGLRPYRSSGFVLRAERLDEKTVVHNYGHGGSGMSLSWGTASLAADIAVQHQSRSAAVIGCGIVGLTTARMLQRRGFAVTIYARSLPPDTTSNKSWAAFTPNSGLVANAARTPEWDDQFRRAVGIAYREHQLLVGRGYGVSWIDQYSATDNLRTGSSGVVGDAQAANDPNRLLPGSVTLGRQTLLAGEHPFGTRYAERLPTMRFEPSIYLETLMRDVLAFGGGIRVRGFDSVADLMALPEQLVVNCSGLGARELFGDEQLTPAKGQLVVLVPQPEVTYATDTMLPRSDGIVLGHVMRRGDASLEVNEDERTRVMQAHMRFFGAMRLPVPGMRLTEAAPPGTAPDVATYLDRES